MHGVIAGRLIGAMTQGRLAELLTSSHVHAPQSSFDMLVLDEADRLLDLGFKQDLERILGYLPKQRRTGLFSASVSEAVGEVIRAGLRNPQRVTVTVKSLRNGAVVDAKTPASLQMSYLVTPASQKLPALCQLLEKLEPRPQRSIVFLSTCRAVEYFNTILAGLLPNGFSLIPLHGKLKPSVREKCFQRFVSSSSPTVLLTTDVAARGLDIPQVDLVVQLDPPSDYRVFLHRAGRAGRAGRRGLAVVMLHTGPEEDFVSFLEVRKTPITPLQGPEISVSEQQVEQGTALIRELAKADRAVFELAQQAFVSWTRAYLEHRSSIFPVEKLDWLDLANGWGLVSTKLVPPPFQLPTADLAYRTSSSCLKCQKLEI
jgi:ATP-dependent RNA helicase DDX55/SPB4